MGIIIKDESECRAERRALEKKRYKACRADRVPDFPEIVLAIVFVMVLSFAIIFSAMMLPEWKENKEIRDSGNDRITANAIGGMDRVTGMTGSGPSPPPPQGETFYDIGLEKDEEIQEYLKEANKRLEKYCNNGYAATANVPTINKDGYVEYDTVFRSGDNLITVTTTIAPDKPQTVKYYDLSKDNPNPSTFLYKDSGSIFGGGTFLNPNTREEIDDSDLKRYGINRQVESDIERTVDSADDIRSEMTEAGRILNDGKMTQGEIEDKEAAWNTITANARSKLTMVLNAYLDDWLGEYTKGVPAAICGDSLYKKEPSDDQEQKKIAGIPVPSTSFGSQMEKDILEGLKTVIMEGEKTEVSPTIYRYALTLKIIGDMSEQWRVFLYNSCTEDDSYNELLESDGEQGWYEYGSISDQAFFGSHWAFLLDCTEGGNCRYDQACIIFSGGGNISNDAAPQKCVSLVHGEGFKTDGETGSRRC
ncbi:hypothetical protein JXB31_04060 [Candidatus Woesearchaeota archaeon]|nr:hypothetical protein [Candidatus Woesearchaeota archaeon]